MSETLFYDPPLADCILENLKCPLLFVYNVLDPSLSLSARDSRRWKRWKWPLLAENVEAQWNTNAIARRYQRPGYQFIHGSSENGVVRVLRLSTALPSVNQTAELNQVPRDNWTRRNGNWRIIEGRR